MCEPKVKIGIQSSSFSADPRIFAHEQILTEDLIHLFTGHLSSYGISKVMKHLKRFKES